MTENEQAITTSQLHIAETLFMRYLKKKKKWRESSLRSPICSITSLITDKTVLICIKKITSDKYFHQ